MGEFDPVSGKDVEMPVSHHGTTGLHSYVALCHSSFPDPQHNPRSANRGPVVPYQGGGDHSIISGIPTLGL